jgi:DNA (cytosine-5)-methyltransferase 1
VPYDLTVGSLFSGIGGFDLGLERAGMRTVWFCEQDPFCQRVLARHWPGVPVHGDVRTLVADAGRGRVQPDGDGGGLAGAQPGDREAVRAGELPPAASSGGEGGGVVPVPVPYVDVLCGGFPCQDLSYAGKGAGIDGERSGLWTEYARLIRELRPRYVIVENVSALLARGLGRVLGDLAACGYDAEWDCIPASAVGAPHRRDRIWLIAYSQCDELRLESGWGSGPRGAGASLADVDGEARALADAHGGGRQVLGLPQPGGIEGELRHLAHGCSQGGQLEHPASRAGAWESEPDVGRVAHGVPHRVDRLRSLGNALVPQIAEWLGHRILAYEKGGVT